MKKRVRYDLFASMKKYIKDLNEDDYEICYTGHSDPDVVEYVKNYYNNHLPIDVITWEKINNTGIFPVYSHFIEEQVYFVEKRINKLLQPSNDDWLKYPSQVISIFYADLVKLPVYQINIKKYEVEVILSFNLYNWKVSIKSNTPLKFNTMGLFDLSRKIPSIYCDGFPENKVYGSYRQNSSRFTLELPTAYDLYTLMYLLKNYLSGNHT